MQFLTSIQFSFRKPYVTADVSWTEYSDKVAASIPLLTCYLQLWDTHAYSIYYYILMYILPPHPQFCAISCKGRRRVGAPSTEILDPPLRKLLVNAESLHTMCEIFRPLYHRQNSLLEKKPPNVLYSIAISWFGFSH